jgi:hypothetical protein
MTLLYSHIPAKTASSGFDSGAWLKSFIAQKMQPKTALDLDIEVGDTLLGGRFKNVPMVVDEIGTDELGQPTVNGRKLLSYRIKKKMPGA